MIILKLALNSLRKRERAGNRVDKLELIDEELACYDALQVNNSSVKAVGDDTLKEIAWQLVKAVCKNLTIDCDQCRKVADLLFAIKKPSLFLRAIIPVSIIWSSPPDIIFTVLDSLFFCHFLVQRVSLRITECCIRNPQKPPEINLAEACENRTHLRRDRRRTTGFEVRATHQDRSASVPGKKTTIASPHDILTQLLSNMLAFYLVFAVYSKCVPLIDMAFSMDSL
jgi:hypothetical protein